MRAATPAMPLMSLRKALTSFAKPLNWLMLTASVGWTSGNLAGKMPFAVTRTN